MSLRAALAWRRCSCADPACPASAAAGLLVDGDGVDGDACCAWPATGSAHNTAAAIAVVHLAVKRFIAWLLPEQNLSNPREGFEQARCHGELCLVFQAFCSRAAGNASRCRSRRRGVRNIFPLTPDSARVGVRLRR